jgi:hypothetical protein
MGKHLLWPRYERLRPNDIASLGEIGSHVSPSGINMGLRTLRRALNLAYAWGVIKKPAKVELAKGENQRDRVLSTEELTAYLENYPQPWQDAATIIADEGMRPGEVFVLRWESTSFG